MIKSLKSLSAITLVLTVSACGNQPSAPVPDANKPAAVAEQPSAAAPAKTPRAAPVQLPANDLVEIPVQENDNQAVPLNAGQSAKGDLIAPRAGSVVAFDALLGTYDNTSDGKLKVELCKDKVCSSGEGDILSSLDNQYFAILLEHPLVVAEGDHLTYRFLKNEGKIAVALWTYPVAANAVGISVDDGKALNHGPKLALQYSK
jgi:predicted small lipoprotein YifL